MCSVAASSVERALTFLKPHLPLSSYLCEPWLQNFCASASADVDPGPGSPLLWQIFYPNIALTNLNLV